MNFSLPGFRASILLVLAALIFTLDVQTVYAQSTQCRQLENALRQFDRNGDFRQMQNNSGAARQL